MFINKSADGRNNICGNQIAMFRKKRHLSQKGLADALQISGLDVDKNAIQRIEAGKRFVTDIELVFFLIFYRCHLRNFLALRNSMFLCAIIF